MSQAGSMGSGNKSGIIQTIAGDTGSITGANVTIFANNATNNSGSTVAFVNSGTISTLNVTDINGSTAIGLSAGSISSNAPNNTFIGSFAANSVTTGGSNIAIGSGALSPLSTGFGNVAIGSSALDSTGTGNYNIGIGYFVGDNNNSTDSNNIYLNTLGTSNDNNVLRIGQATGTGAQELNSAFIHGVYSNAQPSSATVDYVTIDNTNGLLGVTSVATGGVTLNPDTGQGVPVSGASINVQAFSDPNFPNNCGSSVSFYGDNTTIPETLLLNVTDAANFNTIIGLSAGNNAITGSNTVGLGSFALQSLTIGNGNTAVGANAGQLLQDGELNTAVGYYTLLNSVSDSGNTAIGWGALTNCNGGNNNTAIGYQSNNGGTPVDNTAVGVNSLLNSSGERNVAVGVSALQSSMADNNNVAVGYNTLVSCDGGGGNTGCGTKSLQNNLTGSNNTAVGYEAGFSSTTAGNNTSVGTFAGYLNTTGVQNTSLGSNALYGPTSGDNNVAIGFQTMQNSSACFYNTVIGTISMQNGSGNYNTIVGYISGLNYTGIESYNVLLSSSGVTGDNNILRIGDTTGAAVNGINEAYVQGIYNNSQPLSTTVQVVTIDNTTGQLGVTSSSLIPWTDEAASFSAVSGNNYFCTATLTASLPVGAQGDTITIVVLGAGASNVTIQAQAGDFILIGTATSTAGGTAVNNFATGDMVELVYNLAATTWVSTSTIGGWTLA
jgi:trimeric autotransporter adhesin